MSNAFLSACRVVSVSPSAKAVLMCMADYADGGGRCWPSIAAIGEWTCLGKTAINSAIKSLEGAGLIQVDRSNGRHNRYQVAKTAPDLTASRTGTAGEPVRQANRYAPHTSAAGEPHHPARRTAPLREAVTTHQEPPVPLNALSGARAATCSPGEAAAALNRAGARITSQHPDLIAACAEGVTAAQLLELRDAHPGKPAPYLVAIARRHVAENANAATPGTTPNAPNRHLSAVDRIAANIERAHQHHDEPRTGNVLEGHAVRVAR